jgi:hypothetical protein
MYNNPNLLSQQPKRSFCWLCVTLSIIGGFLLTGCTGSILEPTMSATDTANAYYQAIENRDYTKAYSYLSPYYPLGAHEALSRARFIAGSQAEDVAAGPVTSYTQLGSATNNGVVIVIMSVTRRGQSYDVQLQLQQNKGTWQIIEEDCSQFDCPL